MDSQGLRLERAGFLAHAQTAAFERKVEQAENIVRRWLGKCESPYVRFSGGKDSTVMLHLVRSIRPECPAMFTHDEFLLPETEAIVSATPNLRKIAYTNEHASWFVAWKDGPADLPPDVEWIETGEAKDTAAIYQDRYGHDGVAIGSRADENKTRRAYLEAKGPLFEVHSREVWQCYPLAWWTDKDIWAYLVSREVPYNRAYDKLAELGVPLRERRIGPLAVEGPARRGALATLKQGWPDLFNRFSEKYPQARRYV